MIEILRQREGLEPSDTSKDTELNKLSPREKLAEACGWELGDMRWAYWFLRMAEEAGYEIKEKK